MKFYMAGRKIRNIDEMEEGKVYSMCGVVGVFRICETPDDKDLVYNFSEDSESISLTVGRNALIDRINMGCVRAIKKSWHPRPATILKIMGSNKKITCN